MLFIFSARWQLRSAILSSRIKSTDFDFGSVTHLGDLAYLSCLWVLAAGDRGTDLRAVVQMCWAGFEQ